MMVAVAVSTIITFVLFAVFNQTQKAFRASINQVDTLESGRAVLEIVSTDLEMAVPLNLTDLGTSFSVTNFVVTTADNQRVLGMPQVIGESMNPPLLVTNILQEAFFVKRQNEFYEFVGYRVIAPPTPGFARLMRYNSGEYLYDDVQSPTNGFVSSEFVLDHLVDFNKLVDEIYDYNVSSTTYGELLPPYEMQPVADGVVHFRVIPSDGLGYEWTDDRFEFLIDEFEDGRIPVDPRVNFTLEPGPSDDFPPFRVTFSVDRMPAFVDIELGVLDPRAIETLQQMTPGTQVYADFLNASAGQIHLFRRRLPIRSVQ